MAKLDGEFEDGEKFEELINVGHAETYTCKRPTRVIYIDIRIHKSQNYIKKQIYKNYKI